MEIEVWKHEALEMFLGSNRDDFYYELGITKPDIFSKCFYFKVRIRLTYTNQFNGIVFSAVTSSIYEIKYDKEAPTVSFLFNLINAATFEFAKIFHEKTRQTNLLHRKILKPKLSELKDVIQQQIDDWDAPARAYKEEGRKRLLKFRDLPEIPQAKQYNEQTSTTIEQVISHKLLFNRYIDQNERKIFESLSTYYVELNEKLKLLNYSTFSSNDLKDFRDYMLYAFNYIALISNKITINKIYRLVTNESVSGRDEQITDVKFLKYPPLEIVKNRSIYNRANTFNSTLFYATENIDTALKEIRPPKNKLVTVGVWKPNKIKSFISYPIFHGEEAILNNKKILEENKHLQEIESTYDPLFLKYSHYYIKLLSREYSKPVKHNFEYIISAMFSETIFKINDGNPDFNYDCIIYPSVGNEFQTINFAVKPSVIDTDFSLEKIIEFKVEEEMYNRKQTETGNLNPDNISLAKITNFKVATDITNTGQIIW